MHVKLEVQHMHLNFIGSNGLFDNCEDFETFWASLQKHLRGWGMRIKFYCFSNFYVEIKSHAPT
jgi:hypothetical protein